MRAKEFIVEAPGRYKPYQRTTLDNDKLEELMKNSNVRMMLDLISRAEGNTDYDTMVGGGKFKDYSSHPQTIVKLKSRNKKGEVEIIPSTAAGRYQIMAANWIPYKTRLGLKDFSPDSQDKIAIQMLADRGALPYILDGKFKAAIKKTGNQWTSLPASDISQGYGPKDWKWVNNNLADLKKTYDTNKQQDTQVAKTEPSTLEKLRKKASDIISPVISATTTTAKEPPAKKSQPGYYSVGDSHAQGVGGYSGKQWSNLGQTGSSAFDKQHLANIKNIPAGSVVALSMGANDLGSAKLSDIVDQVNKTIAASKAQGHQVVYLLPTASSNPKLQQKREELRQALLKSLDSRDILDLGVAPSGKEVRGGDDVHLDPKGYKKYGEYITQMFTPGSKPSEPPKEVTPPPQSNVVKSVAQPPTVKTTPEPTVNAAPKTDSSLVQQYVDANKPAQTTKSKPEEKPVQKPEQSAIKKSQVKIDSPEYEKMMWDKQIAAGDKFSKEREARLEKERVAKSKGLPIEPPITEPDLDPKGWAAYDAYMDKLQTEKGDKFSKEYQAAEKKAQSTPPEDESYYTKFMNLFK